MGRERVLDLYHDGFGNRQIAREIRSSPGFVQKVINRYNEQNTSLRGIRVGFPSPKIDEQALEYIEVQKLMKPSTYSTELQQRLLLDGVVHPANLPSVSQINKVLYPWDQRFIVAISVRAFTCAHSSTVLKSVRGVLLSFVLSLLPHSLLLISYHYYFIRGIIIIIYTELLA